MMLYPSGICSRLGMVLVLNANVHPLASLSTEPAYGKKVYNMRPDALKMKPKRKK